MQRVCAGMHRSRRRDQIGITVAAIRVGMRRVGRFLRRVGGRPVGVAVEGNWRQRPIAQAHDGASFEAGCFRAGSGCLCRIRIVCRRGWSGRVETRQVREWSCVSSVGLSRGLAGGATCRSRVLERATREVVEAVVVAMVVVVMGETREVARLREYGRSSPASGA